MYRIPNDRGFTLIELLIVISIIGFFALVSLVYLDATRDRGSEAAIQRNLSGLRSQAALYFSDNQTYVGLCTTEALRRMVQAAARAGNIAPNPNPYADADVGDFDSEACHGNATEYAVWVPERASEGGNTVAWCVDSANTSKRVEGVGATFAANTYVCP